MRGPRAAGLVPLLAVGVLLAGTVMALAAPKVAMIEVKGMVCQS